MGEARERLQCRQTDVVPEAGQAWFQGRVDLCWAAWRGCCGEALQRGTGPSRHRVGAEEESRTCEIWAPWPEGNFSLGLGG